MIGFVDKLEIRMDLTIEALARTPEVSLTSVVKQMEDSLALELECKGNSSVRCNVRFGGFDFILLSHNSCTDRASLHAGRGR